MSEHFFLSHTGGVCVLGAAVKHHFIIRWRMDGWMKARREAAGEKFQGQQQSKRELASEPLFLCVVVRPALHELLDSFPRFEASCSSARSHRPTHMSVSDARC